MGKDVRARLLALLALATLGVSLAAAGSTLGVGGPVAGSDASGELSVSDGAITFSDGDREVTAVENLTGVTRVDIAEEDGTFRVETASTDPLTADQRERAAEIARANGTVQRYLASVDQYGLRVEPIQRINASSIEVTTGEFERVGQAGANESSTFRVTVRDSESGDDSVTVDRDPSYVEDRASVRIQGPAGDLQLSVTIDLTTDAVVSLTDWREIRGT